MNTGGFWIVKVQHRNGPAEIHGGIGSYYNTEEIAQEVADELVTYDSAVTSAWPEFVPPVDYELNPKHLGG